jgi:hypothetical protein
LVSNSLLSSYRPSRPQSPCLRLSGVSAYLFSPYKVVYDAFSKNLPLKLQKALRCSLLYRNRLVQWWTSKK